MIQPERVQSLNTLPPRAGRHVVYWMQASQRAEDNHALEYALRQANERRLPLLVVFGLTPAFPEAGTRHYRFMLEGLRETQRALRKRRLGCSILLANPPAAALSLASAAALLVCDRGYLRVQQQWREQVAREAPCPVVQVESDAVIPVETASPKEEFGARTLRPKLHRLLEGFLQPLVPTRPNLPSLALEPPGLDLTDLDAVLHSLKLPATPHPTGRFTGGPSQGLKLFDHFLDQGLPRYVDRRADALADAVSHQGPYLHFGQVSPLRLLLSLPGLPAPEAEAYLEQVLVRRELALNFVHYNPGYDRYEDAIPAWARETLAQHAGDPRTLYSLEQLESATTDDPYWNAMMREIVATGYLHNYLRMYWGKRIIEWSPSPEEAYARLAALNNRYFTDGRDPVSWGNIAWCFGKHDRPWPGRPVFGTVRYMNAAGLRRKFNADEYAQRHGALPQ